MRLILLLLISLTNYGANPFTFRAGIPTSLPVSGNNILPNLLAYYPMDETLGNLTNAVVSTNYLFAQNGTVPDATGIVNHGRYFSSTDHTEYFQMSYDSKFSFTNNSFTISAWAYFNARALDPNDMTILTRGGLSGDLSWWLYLDHGSPNDAMVFNWSTDGSYVAGNSATYTFSGEIGSGWNFIVVKWNGTTISMSVTHYTQTAVNAYTTKACSGSFYNSSQTIKMGAITGSNLHDMGGYIDEVLVSTRALDDCSIHWLFTQKAGSFGYSSFNSFACIEP